ncbi:MAG: bifunctional pyr operon transcriptional regulator/uracil phosphoribosyltransferase [Elusimicrobia bacterium RIFOXYA2_FULL_39_19]|nr:MAG: bifunctional pyr operon transcriptional regulator/uracil phosphoribosyltransferase [Elusimicrobia bacterium RIFOXYA2_FULL_39_19]
MSQHILMTSKEMNSAIEKMADDIIKSEKDMKNVVLIGIVTRGVCLAERLVKTIKKKTKIEPGIGSLDITFYRDDIGSIATQPLAKETQIPFDLTDKKIILVDDVIFTGRSTRAALDGLMDYARPRSIQLAVLVERKHRELPIQADYVGKKAATKYDDKVQVYLKETDKIDKVVVYETKN